MQETLESFSRKDSVASSTSHSEAKERKPYHSLSTEEEEKASRETSSLKVDSVQQDFKREAIIY